MRKKEAEIRRRLLIELYVGPIFAALWRDRNDTEEALTQAFFGAELLADEMIKRFPE